MNEYLINKHNETVTQADECFDLGDFAFYGKPREIAELVMNLNGNIILIQGNHDSQSKWTKILKLLDGETLNGKPKLEFHPMGIHKKINGIHLYLTHFPLDAGLRPKIFSVSGHIHSEPSKLLNQINVGVDSPLIEKEVGLGVPIEQEQLMGIIMQRKEEILKLKYKE